MGTKNPSFNFGLPRYACIASGIADTTWNQEVGYLVVRGISDYCDPHKNDDGNVSIVAAAYTRTLIESIP